jgi:hypothetical protein
VRHGLNLGVAVVEIDVDREVRGCHFIVANNGLALRADDAAQRKPGALWESRRVFLWGAGKIRIYFIALTFNVWRRLRQLEILGSEGG